MKRIFQRARFIWRRLFPWQWLHGDYADWAQARKKTSHADGAAQLARVRHAAREVVAGRAAWDRDGVVFMEPAVHAPLLAALRRAAAAHGRRLDLVDFGGGLGCTWRQHQAALSELQDVRWRVVERPALAAVGAAEFAAAGLSFHASLEEAMQRGKPDVVLLSSVLAYLEKPEALLASLKGQAIDDIIVDRTPFVAAARDRIVVQRTPPELGGGSHPCRLFSRSSFVAGWMPNYELVDEWPVTFDRIDGIEYQGFHFRRRQNEGGNRS